MKEIPLVNSDRKAKVDDEDYEWASQYEWFLSPEGYAVRFERAGDDMEVIIEMGEEVLRRAGKL